MPDAIAFFTGVNSVQSFHGTISQGITPSLFRLTIAPQVPNIPLIGDLIIFYKTQTSNEAIIYRDCLVDSGSFSFDASGYLVSLAILDRRWKWTSTPLISGQYNLRYDDNSIVKQEGQTEINAIASTEKTPRELAQICLDALGEDTADISELPNEARPIIQWDEANAADALAGLCDELNCTIAMQRNTQISEETIKQAEEEPFQVAQSLLARHFNPIRIVRLGQGAALPAGPIVTDAMEINPPIRPDTAIVKTSPILVQWDFKLEPVGEETDGKIVPINDLTYTPAGGWIEMPDEIFFMGIENDQQRELAMKTIYRWYRVTLEGEVMLNPLSADIVQQETLLRILPMRQNLLTVLADDHGFKREADAIVYGKWFDWHILDDNNVATIAVLPTTNPLDHVLVVKRGFSIDDTKGIVKFSEPVVQIDANDDIQPAELRLRIAVGIRDLDTRAFLRDRRTRPLNLTPPDSGGQQILYQNDIEATIVREDIQPIWIGNFQQVGFGNDFEFTDWTTNETEVDAAAAHYLDRYEESLTNDPSQQRTYAGIMSGVDIDGAISSITWNISAAGTIVTITRLTSDEGGLEVPFVVARGLERQAEIQAKEARDLAIKRRRQVLEGAVK